ncbi:MAG: N-6 DNA methylase [Candidatus Loosdrechtia sp.]|uniref:type I restriction-modification system subunit M/S n=1 Tax=Candidatus Loosdrechtia sp. TaxID=3101272 RepID=UPI003A688FCB|nr:MAG: N-6 DNA methylase [Candidatus Jettenia sp. AMX2]
MKNNKTQVFNNKISEAIEILHNSSSTLSHFDSFKIVFVLIAYKRFNDILEQNGASDKSIITIPESYRWSCLDFSSEQLFKLIDKNFREISSANKGLGDIADALDIQRYQQNISPLTQKELLNTFDSLDLSLNNFSLKEFVEIVSAFFEQHAESTGIIRSKTSYIPNSLCKLIVKLLNPQISEKLYNPHCGFGDILIAAITHIYENHGWPNKFEQYNLSNNIDIYEEDKEILGLAKLRLAMAGVLFNSAAKGSFFNENKADVLVLRYLFDDYYMNSDDYIYKIIKFKNIYNSRLIDNGRMGILLPQNQLSNMRTDKFLKELNFKNDYIESVIQLPLELYPSLNTNLNLLIINKNKSIDRKHKVIYTKVSPFIRDGLVSISHEEIERIVTAYNNFETRTKDEEIVTYEEIQQNNFNLSPNCYVGTTPSEIKKLRKDETGIPLKDMYKIECGKTKKRPEKDKQGLPFISTLDLSTNLMYPYVNFNNVTFGKPASEGEIIRQKCILVSLLGDTLRQTIFDPNLPYKKESIEDDIKYPEILVSRNIVVIVPKENIDLEYLFYQLYSPIVRKQHAARHKNTRWSFPRITLSDLKTIIIPIFKSLEDQRIFINQYKSTLFEAENARLETLKERLKLVDKKQEAEFSIIRHLAHNINPKIYNAKSPINDVIKFLEERQLIDEILSTRLDGTKETVGEALNISIKNLNQVGNILKSARDLITREIRKDDFQDIDVYELFINDIKPLYTNKPYKLIVKKVNRMVDGHIQLHKEHFVEAINNIIINAEYHAFNESFSDARLEFDIDGNDENITIDYKIMEFYFQRI